MMSGCFRRKNRSSSQHKTSEDFRLTKRNKKSKNLHLFFSEIMRKLKRSSKKEKPQQHDKRLLMMKKKKKRFQKSLSTKDHFFFERMVSRSDHQEHYYELLLKNEDFEEYNQRRIVSLLPEYLSPFSSPGRIWDHDSTVILKSPASDDFIKSETLEDSADDSIAIKEIKREITNYQITDEISKVEAETLKERQSLLSVASPSHYISKDEEYKLLLNPIFNEYEINPTRGEAKIQPLYPMDEKESIFKYVKAVLDGIDSNWEDLYLKTEFSDQLLNPALLSNIPFHPNQLCLDHELLFDCINEVLFEFCSFPPWIEPKTQIFSFDIQSIVHEVQEKVYFHLSPLRLALDIIEDFAKPEYWLDIRCDLEWIGFEISELILNELLEELILDL